MTPTETIVRDAACGNGLAHHFLLKAGHHFHAADDLVDEKFDPFVMLDQFREAIELYTHPFFVQHADVLKGVSLALLRQYRDSVVLERQQAAAVPDVWKERVGDVLRCSGNELVIAVAQICGGTAHADAISQRLRHQSWLEHHDKDNRPV